MDRQTNNRVITRKRVKVKNKNLALFKATLLDQYVDLWFSVNGLKLLIHSGCHFGHAGSKRSDTSSLPGSLFSAQTQCESLFLPGEMCSRQLLSGQPRDLSRFCRRPRCCSQATNAAAPPRKYCFAEKSSCSRLGEGQQTPRTQQVTRLNCFLLSCFAVCADWQLAAN